MFTSVYFKSKQGNRCCSVMKLFLRNTMIFALPIILSAISFEGLLRKIPNDYSYKKDYLDRNSRTVEILFLGNSHIYYGIDPKYINRKSFNAAGVSQSLNYDLAIIKKYETKWDSLKCIVLPIDYLSLYTTLESGIESWRVKNYSIYYDININHNILYNTELFTNSFIANLTNAYNYYYKHNVNTNCSLAGWGTKHQGSSHQDLDATGKSAAERHTMSTSAYLAENLETVSAIIKFAKSKNVSILFFTCPVYKSYSENLDSNQLNNTIRKADSLVRTYGNASYINLLNDKDFTAADFYDADHLNDIGAKKLTLKIYGFLKK